MSTVLVLTSSVNGEASASNSLVAHAVAQLRHDDLSLKIVRRDLAANPVPHLNADSATVLRGSDPVNPAQVAARDLSDTLISEVLAADTVLIGAPMYNFGIPSTLKSWFDHVLRAGITFRYGETGPEGLAKGKRALVIESRGGIYSEGPARTMDSQEPHLRTLLGFIGITDVTFVRAEKLAFGPEASEAALRSAKSEIETALAATSTAAA